MLCKHPAPRYLFPARDSATSCGVHPPGPGAMLAAGRCVCRAELLRLWWALCFPGFPCRRVGPSLLFSVALPRAGEKPMAAGVSRGAVRTHVCTHTHSRTHAHSGCVYVPALPSRAAVPE